jgi:hypothetical protein
MMKNTFEWTCTFFIIVCIGFFFDGLYDFYIKPLIVDFEGIYATIIKSFILISRCCGGIALGLNGKRINNWIWNKN